MSRPTDAHTVSPDAVPAWQALTSAVARLERRVPCVAMPTAYVSDDHRERAEAAQACAHCPALQACQTFARANRERWHVWGGTDLTTAYGTRAVPNHSTTEEQR